MYGMFFHDNVFNQDLSAWGVSAVTNMNGMFNGAQSFNQDLSAWDVSAVTDMSGMFSGATSFDQILCGVSWVNSKAKQENMFTDSSGSISLSLCTSSSTTTAVTTTTKKTIISSINNTVTVAIVAITVVVIMCVIVVVVAIVRAPSKRASGDIKLSEIPFISSNDLPMPNCGPVFTSPAGATEPNNTVVEEKTSNGYSEKCGYSETIVWFRHAIAGGTASTSGVSPRLHSGRARNVHFDKSKHGDGEKNNSLAAMTRSKSGGPVKEPLRQCVVKSGGAHKTSAQPETNCFSR